MLKFISDLNYANFLSLAYFINKVHAEKTTPMVVYLSVVFRVCAAVNRCKLPMTIIPVLHLRYTRQVIVYNISNIYGGCEFIFIN